MARELPFPVVDADHHLYESIEAFTRYLPAEYEGLIKIDRAMMWPTLASPLEDEQAKIMGGNLARLMKVA